MRYSVKNRDCVSLVFETMIYHEGKIWFTESDGNGLFVYDPITKETNLFCYIEEENENTNRLFGAMLIKNNFLYLAPFAATSMYRLNIITKEIAQIPIKKPEQGKNLNYDDEAKFLSIFCYENSIYMVGASYPGILEYNLETEEVAYLDSWMDDLSKYNLVNDNALIRKAIMIEDKIYAPLCRGNAMLVYQVKTNTYKIHQIGSSKCNFSAVCFDGRNFWLAPRNTGPIVKWNEESGEWTEYNQFPTDSMRIQNSSNDIVFYNGKILLLPGSDIMIMAIDIVSGHMMELDEKLRGMKNVVYCYGDDCIYICGAKSGLMVRYDDVVCQPEMIYIEKEKIKSKEPSYEMFENGIETLDMLLAYIKDESSSKKREAQIRNTGEIIWSKMK